MKSKTRLSHKIEKNIGKNLLDMIERSRNKKTGPIMIPPIPESQFIDKLPEGVLKGANLQEKEHQDAYEAEVKVYRCLEELEKDYIVIHQLDYTHKQYSAFVGDHNCNNKRCKKGKNGHLCHKDPKQTEGETDFVLVGKTFVAIFEIKALKFQSTEEDKCMWQGCCEGATLQRKRMKGLIQSIDPSQMVFEFTVFPNVSIDEVNEDFVKDETILFSEDIKILKTITDCCEELISLTTVRMDVREKLKCCLLGLRCINHDESWNLDKCHLTKCILDIDQRLRKALVTRKLVDKERIKEISTRRKGKAKIRKYPKNPDLVEAPKIFKEYLKISSLTQDQLDVFNSEERFLWVEGPAGGGKTVVMLGRIINIVLNEPSQRRILVILKATAHSPVLDRHYQVLNEITTCTIEHYGKIEGEGFTFDEHNVAKSRTLNHLHLPNTTSRIVFLAMYDAAASDSMYYFITSFDYVFVDDYQQLSDFSHGTSSDIIKLGLLPLVEKSATNMNNTSLWIFNDDGQRKMYDQFVCFRMFSPGFADIVTATCSFDLPQQKIGHFLRGAKPVIYLLKEDNPAACMDILEQELKKLRGSESSLDDEDIIVFQEMVDKHGWELDSALVYALKKWNLKNKIIKRLLYIDSCVSSEWPTVICLYRYNSTFHFTIKLPNGYEDKFLCSYAVPFLYKAISRARVYCTAIIYNYKKGLCEYADELLSKLRERRDVCRIVE